MKRPCRFCKHRDVEAMYSSKQEYCGWWCHNCSRGMLEGQKIGFGWTKDYKEC